MQLIGHWMSSLSDITLPLPQECVGGYPPGVRELLVAYLNAGEVFATYRGFSWCRFHCGLEGASGLGHQEFTDGRWVWPGGLSHYVEHHEVRLPDEFAQDALHPRPCAVDLDAEADPTFWTKWSEKNRLPAVRQFLLTAQTLARHRAYEDLDQRQLTRVRDLEAKEGLADQPCLFQGCSKSALRGRLICAAHFGNEHVDTSCYRLSIGQLLDIEQIVRASNHS